MPKYWREFFLILLKKFRMRKADSKLLEMLLYLILAFDFVLFEISGIKTLLWLLQER